MPEADTPEFEDLGDIEIPPKEDIHEERIKSRVEAKIEREQIEDSIRQETGTEKEKPKTPIPPDVPALCFRMIAKAIECPKFELDDEEARTVAHHLTILLPVDGKIISAVIILMVVLNKVITCMDAIKKKLTPAPIAAAQTADPRDSVKPVYKPDMDANQPGAAK